MTRKLLFISVFTLALGFSCPQAHAAQSVELIEVEQQTKIIAYNNSLHIIGGNGLTMEVYNVAGVRVMNAKVDGAEKIFDLSLPKGCYIVKVGKIARKISIK